MLGCHAEAALVKADFPRPSQQKRVMEHNTGKVAKHGPLIPYITPVRHGDKIKASLRGSWDQGLTLHNYRYAWAERAKIAGLSRMVCATGLGPQQ